MAYSQHSRSWSHDHPFTETRNAITRPITISEDAIDSGATPTSYLRGGLVLQEDDNGNFVHVGGPNAKAFSAATLLSLIVVGATWASKVLTFRTNGGEQVSVALGADDDTISEVVNALNNNDDFADEFVAADDGGGKLQVTSKNFTTEFEATADLDTIFGASGTEAKPDNPAVVILKKPVIDLDRINGSPKERVHSAVNANASVDETKVYGLTMRTRMVLEANNINFV
jgi:hypothetical protein